MMPSVSSACNACCLLGHKKGLKLLADMNARSRLRYVLHKRFRHGKPDRGRSLSS